MIHVRHAARRSGLSETALITHGESGRSGAFRGELTPPKDREDEPATGG
ncbi:MAG TPA: hypothetical protein VNZ53_13840 [Steroidobacteraceae bacterium]|jgi:hypothetical protein|nr:hypothetical protein [Steroidobacteraceae bacterium]